eukprot:439576_1
MRIRTFYKNTKQIADKCSNLKRIRPNSAPLKKSQSVSNIHKLKNKSTTNLNKPIRKQRPYSAKTHNTQILHSYRSASNIIFKPNKTINNKSQILKMNKYIKNKNKYKCKNITTTNKRTIFTSNTKA